MLYILKLFHLVWLDVNRVLQIWHLTVKSESLPAPWITPCSLNHSLLFGSLCSLNHSLLFGSLCSLNHSLLFGSLCSLSLNLFGCPIFSRFSFIQFLASLSDVLTLHKVGSLLYIFAVAWHTQFVSFLLFFAFIDLWVMCLILIWRSFSWFLFLSSWVLLSPFHWLFDGKCEPCQWDLISAH